MFRIGVAALLLVLATASSAQSLRVGVALDNPPFSYEQAGAVVGIEPDNARALGALLNRKIQLVPLPFDGLVEALLEGKVDVAMGGLISADSPADGVAFATPYLTTGQMAIVLQDNAGRFAYPWAIFSENLRVGVETGTAGEQFARGELKDATVSGYADVPAAYAALRAKDIHVFVHDAATSYLLATSPEDSDLFSTYKPLTQQSYAWAVREDDYEFLRRLDRALRTMKSGRTLRYILDRWIPVSIQSN